MPDPSKEEEDVDPDNPILIIDKRKVPEFVVQLEAEDEFLNNRIKSLSEEAIVETHYTEEGMKRRLTVYKKDNFSESGNSVLKTFFNENKIKVLNVPCEGNSNDNIFNAIKILVERVNILLNILFAYLITL